MTEGGTNPSQYADAQRLVASLNRIFRDEGLAYSVDEFGQVRNIVDREFAAATESTAKALDRPAYETARQHFEIALSEFAAIEGDARKTVRESFEAVECLFKQVFSVDRLNAEKIRNAKPMVIGLGKDDSQRDFLENILDAFRSWVDAAHNYRHSNPESVRAPDRGDVVIVVSQAVAYLRWLVDVGDRMAEAE
ncbi:hypothetical protein [Lentisalinibacter orientalis]|uniref:hypothetical protein n=1 Tax=Lentisalinibacter orientalis TaxID=2992241 RepID=UPI003864F6DD